LTIIHRSHWQDNDQRDKPKEHEQDDQMHAKPDVQAATSGLILFRWSRTILEPRLHDRKGARVTCYLRMPLPYLMHTHLFIKAHSIRVGFKL